MASVNFEFRDCSYKAFSSSLSLEELKSVPSSEQVEVLQRHFLYCCDVLDKNGVDVEILIAALLGSAIQEYLDKSMLKHVESAKERFSDIPPTYVATYEFMKAQGKMMANQGWDAGVAGLGMSHAGLDVATLEYSPATVLKAMEGKLEELANRKPKRA